MSEGRSERRKYRPVHKLPFDANDPEYTERIDKRLSITEVVREFTPPEPDDVCILGTYSRSWRNKRKREILSGKAIELNGRTDSPTAHVRDYILYCYGRRPAKNDQRNILKAKSMPLYANPGIIKDAVYLDISSAWFSIVSLVGWNLEYNPGRWFARGDPPLDFPFSGNKVARSALVSLGRTSKLPVWNKGRLETQHMYNTCENLHIWGVIADVLNSIAYEAVKIGARYVNTDGFIISRRNADYLASVIMDWGLSVKVKHEGDAIICGVGAYQVGQYHTVKSTRFHPADTIDREVNSKWLQDRVTKRIVRARVNVAMPEALP